MESAEEPHTPASSVPVILEVGEQRFKVSRDTLSGSPMLAAKVSERWSSDSQNDGSYFVDADPEIFKHILRFLRHGVYPLCYDKAKGHDFATYALIQKQADYFGVQKLVTWLRKELYLQAITITVTARIAEDVDEIEGRNISNDKISHYPTWKTVRNYVCPRGLSKHYGNPKACGFQCRKARGDAEDEYDDCSVPSSTLILIERHVANKHVWMGNEDDGED
ncbi:MAG: hypothetical protein Q9198_006380 [Flavoplaca austrocitrina]